MRTFILALITFYQRCLSPFLPPSCRFQPSCSEYARDAVCQHGALKGTGLTLLRLVRCHPLCRGGYDPVPPATAPRALQRNTNRHAA